MDMPVVKKILESYWDWKLPVQIADIAAHLNICVEPLNPQDPEQKLLSGLAEIKNEKRYIYFNRNESYVRQRFTLAHEIGHHILNHVTPCSPKHRDDLNAFSVNSCCSEEREANSFAAQLLMPEDAINYMLFNQGVSNISDLAKKFEVSEVAMHYRLKNLGLLSY